MNFGIGIMLCPIVTSIIVYLMIYVISKKGDDDI